MPEVLGGLTSSSVGYISTYQKESLHDKRSSLRSCEGKVAEDKKRANSCCHGKKGEIQMSQPSFDAWKENGPKNETVDT